MKRLIICIIFMLTIVSCGNVTLKLPDIIAPQVYKIIQYHEDRIDIRDDMIYSYGGTLEGVQLMAQFKGKQLLGFRTFPSIEVPDSVTPQILQNF